MKILVWMVVPAIIIYIFWVTYKYFNRRAPQEGSNEDLENIKNDLV